MKHIDYVEALNSCLLFNNINENTFEKIFSNLSIAARKYLSEQIILDYDRKSIGIILSGVVDIKRYLDDGNVFLQKRLNTGDVFGISSIFTYNESAAGDLYCKADADIAYFSENNMMKLFDIDKQILKNYLYLTNTKIVYLNDTINMFTHNISHQRLLSFLKQLSAFQGKNQTATLYYTKTELAEMLLMGRTSLYRSFDFLEEHNFIEVKGNIINILK